MKALILLAAGLLVKADVPANCLRKNIHDQLWNFHVSQDSQVVNLFEQREVCTHEMPNRVQLVEPHHRFAFEKEAIW